jgi:hypothetical protein
VLWRGAKQSDENHEPWACLEGPSHIYEANPAINQGVILVSVIPVVPVLEMAWTRVQIEWLEKRPIAPKRKKDV